MILGRPANTWTGLITLISGAIATTLVAAGVDAALVATLIGPWTAVLGGIVLLIANQPPTLNPGDAYTVVTSPGEPNVSKVANTNVTPIPPNAGVTDEGINP